MAWLPCHIHAYTVYTSIGGKGSCRTRRDLQDHHIQARKSAGERSTSDLKPVRKDTRSPKQEQSVAPQTGPWSNNNKKKPKTGVDKIEAHPIYIHFVAKLSAQCISVEKG